MKPTRDTSRPRRPLSFVEVGVVAGMVVLVFGVGLYMPSLAIHSASARQPGISLMNVVQPAPAPGSELAAAGITPDAKTIDALPLEPAIDEAMQGEPVVTFNGRPLRKVKQLNMLTTAYSPDEKSCGKWADGFTASGYSVWTNGMKLVAADTNLLPFGTIVTIPGYNNGNPVQVLDRGGKIKGHRLDLLYPTHEIALQWGAQRLEVEVWEYAD